MEFRTIIKSYPTHDEALAEEARWPRNHTEIIRSGYAQWLVKIHF